MSNLRQLMIQLECPLLFSNDKVSTRIPDILVYFVYYHIVIFYEDYIMHKIMVTHLLKVEDST